MSASVRRWVLRWQLFAIPILPLWLLVGFGIFGHGVFAFLLHFVSAVALFVVLGVAALLTRLRPSVRASRALSPRDALLTLAWHLAIVGLGLYGAGTVPFGLIAVGLGLVVFWLTIGSLAREAREGMASAAARSPFRRPSVPRDGDVYVVREPRR